MVTNVIVTLRNITHAWSRDIDVVLVAPNGRAVILMSDVGNGLASGVTGEIHHVDAGYNVIGMKAEDAPDISVG